MDPTSGNNSMKTVKTYEKNPGMLKTWMLLFLLPFFVEKLPTFQLIWIIQVWRLGHVPEPLSNKICVASCFHPIRMHKEGSISSRNIQIFFFNPLQLGVKNSKLSKPQPKKRSQQFHFSIIASLCSFQLLAS